MSELTPKVGIVIPTWNRRQDLLACLHSLTYQTYQNWFAVVVDNHSEDDTVHAVRLMYPDTHCIELRQNAGATGASNIGFEWCLNQGAEYVLRLDSDTIVGTTALERLVFTAELFPEAGIFSAKIYYYANPNRVWFAGADSHPFHFGALQTGQNDEDTPENSAIKIVDYAWSTAMLIRQNLLKTIGGFDPRFVVYYEEVDLCLRAKQAGFRIMTVPLAQVWHKIGEQQRTNWVAYHWNRSKILLYRKHAPNIIHLVALINYSLLYMIYSICYKRTSGGNRGPLRATVSGIWAGLRTSTK